MPLCKNLHNGKSFLCQALGNAACRRLIPTRYVRLADMFDALDRARAARGDGLYWSRAAGGPPT